VIKKWVVQEKKTVEDVKKEISQLSPSKQAFDDFMKAKSGSVVEGFVDTVVVPVLKKNVGGSDSLDKQKSFYLSGSFEDGIMSDVYDLGQELEKVGFDISSSPDQVVAYIKTLSKPVAELVAMTV